MKKMPEPEMNLNSETATNKLFNLADKARDEETHYPTDQRYKEELLTNAAREANQGNYSRSQTILESGTMRWDDTLRDAASQMNRLEQQGKGRENMSFDVAQKTISAYAREIEDLSKKSGGRQQGLEEAMMIDNIVADLSVPGLEGINTALSYIEGVLKSNNHTYEMSRKSKGSIAQETSRELLKSIEEKRSIRDALFAEKIKRQEAVQHKPKASGRTPEEIHALRRRLEAVMPSPVIGEAKEKPADAKLKFGHVLNNLVTQFRDGTLPTLFEHFIKNKPDQKEYAAVTKRLNALYADYLKDHRAPSDKISDFKQKLTQLSKEVAA